MQSPASVLEALEDHLEAIGERDIDRFAASLAQDDVRFVGGDGSILEGKEIIVAAHRDWFAASDWQFVPEILSTREESGAAWALTRVRYTEKGTARIFLLLFILTSEAGAWRIAYDQSTPIKIHEE